MADYDHFSDHAIETLQGASPRDTDDLHLALQTHIDGCRTCQEQVNHGRPRGFGQTSRMCDKYNELVTFFSEGTNLR